MGCDIHAVFQTKTKDGWVEIPSMYTEDRDYNLFAKLADVRNYNDVKPIAQPRGLPDGFVIDDNQHYKMPLWYINDYAENSSEYHDFWMGDHSYSWLMYDEILDNQSELPLYFTDEIKRLVKYYGNIRMIFGFDS